jgi:hypothetical protein
MVFSAKNNACIIGFLVAGLLVASISCKKNITTMKLLYLQDFEKGIPPEIMAYSADGRTFGPFVRSFNGTNIAGAFNNSLLRVNLMDLPTHNMIRISFDLLIHDQWRGDNWNIRVDGQNQLVTTFSNTPGIGQAYPDWVGIARNVPARGNAADTLINGFCLWESKNNGSSLYKVVFSRPHKGKDLLLQMDDASAGSPCQNSWSIDNLRIETIVN